MCLTDLLIEGLSQKRAIKSFDRFQDSSLPFIGEDGKVCCTHRAMILTKREHVTFDLI